MTTYTATAHRGDHRWILQCDQVPGAITEVDHLDQGVQALSEAIAFVAQVNLADVAVQITALS